jgi:hypothetical protein
MVLVITEDRKIIKRLIEKALYVGVKKATGMRIMQEFIFLKSLFPT